MGQALHIFKKDVRQLWFQIVLVLAATAMFGYTGITSSWATPPNYVPAFAFNARPLIAPDVDMGGIGAFTSSHDVTILPELLVFLWCCLIALVVHADAIPGDRQFWLTRPYNRGSLWGAKALFVLAFVNLPMFATQAAIIAAAGLPVVSNLSGLLWEQVLFSAVITIPAMAAATLTRTMTQFVFLLLFAAFAASGFTFLILIPFPFLSPWSFEERTTGSLEWLNYFVGIIAIVATTFTILFWQFMRRRTAWSRVLAVSGAALAFAAFWYVPWTPVFAVQSLLARPLGNAIHAEITRPRSNLPRFGITDTVDLPLRIAGLPAGALLACEAATIRIESAAGAAWQSDVIRLGSRISQAPDGCRVRAVVDHAFFSTNRSRQVRIRSALYLTVFGNERTTVTAPGAGPVNVPGVGVCRATRSEQGLPAVMCRTAFRWPRRLVWTRDDTGRGELFAETMSYSPFPAELRISPVEDAWAKAFLNESGDVAIVAQEPIAHVHSDVELAGVELGDLEFGARE
jgi:hypothetical protein